ncbi:MAG: T9SS type A sorting domain-containing protein [Flavobacteriales bacterium]|nr:T9SS type A sorting domain-containing protein [Flavobacteriales bacterium]
MKKTLLLICVAIFTFSNSHAQLADGSVAPDWTLTDLNGTTHNLYSYLDNGYTVFIDFSAVWCGPCWSYHISGALEDLYMNHGPAGMPNVNANTTDDVMVFFIEGDENTVGNLGGVGGNTQGDWITGTPYPIICTDGTVNNDAVTGDYEIGYWPTVYKICSDRIVTEAGQNSSPYSLVNCPPPASNDNDARTFDYSGETLTCEGDLTPEVMIQNYGLVPLTSVSVDVEVNGSLVSTTPWSGNLTTYATDMVSLTPLTGLNANDAVTMTVHTPNGVVDADPSNNPSMSFYVEMATQNTDVEVTVQINTDAYGSETTWDIKDDNGAVVGSGGPYNNLTAAGITAQTPETFTLNELTCHTFTIYDSYGDGIDAGYGAGSFTVTDANGTTLASGGQFTSEDGGAFKTGSVVVAGINNIDNTLSIYPNPVQNKLIINGNYSSVDIVDVHGKLVLSSKQIDEVNVSTLADGVYMLNITTERGINKQKITIAK